MLLAKKQAIPLCLFNAFPPRMRANRRSFHHACRPTAEVSTTYENLIKLVIALGEEASYSTVFVQRVSTTYAGQPQKFPPRMRANRRSFHHACGPTAEVFPPRMRANRRSFHHACGPTAEVSTTYAGQPQKFPPRMRANRRSVSTTYAGQPQKCFHHVCGPTAEVFPPRMRTNCRSVSTTYAGQPQKCFCRSRK